MKKTLEIRKSERASSISLADNGFEKLIRLTNERKREKSMSTTLKEDRETVQCVSETEKRDKIM